MSSRYDSRTTTFSPEGRLYQVEYAVEATSHAGTAIGILTKEGIVLAAEKRLQNVLLDSEVSHDPTINADKLHTIDSHVGCAIAGITSDANTLVNYMRKRAHNHRFTFGEPMVCEDICRNLCDLKQNVTQSGGVRPFGVAFLIAGWDKHFGFQLYHTDPSGNYSGWQAYAVGAGDEVAMGILKQEWKAGMSLLEGQLLAIKVLSKTMDVNGITGDRVEMATLTISTISTRPLPRLGLQQSPGNCNPQFRIVQPSELKPILEEAEKLRLAAEEEAKKKTESQKA